MSIKEVSGLVGPDDDDGDDDDDDDDDDTRPSNYHPSPNRRLSCTKADDVISVAPLEPTNFFPRSYPRACRGRGTVKPFDIHRQRGPARLISLMDA